MRLERQTRRQANARHPMWKRRVSGTAFDVRTLIPFRFSSEYADDVLGLVYYNYRHYNSVDGRWTSRDMIGESGCKNVFVFTSNAYNSSDVLGLICIVPPEMYVLMGQGSSKPSQAKCQFLKSMLFCFAGFSIGRQIYNAWSSGGGIIDDATPDDFDDDGSIRKKALYEVASRTIWKNVYSLPCGEKLKGVETGVRTNYFTSSVYAIRGFRLMTSCTLDFEPICSNGQCCRVKVSGRCKFDFYDEFVFRKQGAFVFGLVEENTIKMCAEEYGWKVGPVFTIAKDDEWTGTTYVNCPSERLPRGMVPPLTE